MCDWDADAWDSATQGRFATYSESGVLDVVFTSNDFGLPEKPDRFGKTSPEFDVIQNGKAVTLVISSVRLMQALKKILPLENKRIRITRSGSRMSTRYTVEEISSEEEEGQ